MKGYKVRALAVLLAAAIEAGNVMPVMAASLTDREITKESQDTAKEPKEGEETGEPTDAPAPTEEPSQEETPVPTAIPTPEETAVPMETDSPTAVPTPTAIPSPDETAVPAETPVPDETLSPEITSTPEETQTPEGTSSPDETSSPEETSTPEATQTPEETPTLTPTPMDEEAALKKKQAEWAKMDKAALENQESCAYFYEPTQKEIAQKWKELNFNLSKKDSFAKNPNATDGGKLSDATSQNALDILNFIRYTAGVPSDVQLSEQYRYESQCGTYLNWKNNTMSHYPKKPSGVSDEFYDAGYKGASNSNIAWASYNMGVAQSILLWLGDSDTSTIESLGHRIQMIKPDLSLTGFGAAGTYYSAMHTDYGRKEEFTQDYMCWPAKNMPVELYTESIYAFSVGLGSGYDTPNVEDLTVTVTSRKENKTWTLTKNNKDKKGLYLTVSDQPFSWTVRKWIIFNVKKFSEGDQVHVKIEGLTKNGAACDPIEYDVNFFSASDYKQKAESVTVTVPAETIRENKTLECSVQVLPEDTLNKKVTWKVESLDTGSGTINASGLFTAKTAGRVKITATAQDGSFQTGEKIITILPAKIPELTKLFEKTELVYTGAAAEFHLSPEAIWRNTEGGEDEQLDTSKAVVTYYSDAKCTKKINPQSIVKAGSYWARVELKGSEEYEDCMGTAELKVLPAMIDADEVSVTGLVEKSPYTGSAVLQKNLKLTYNGTQLAVNKDYTVAYSNNKNISEEDAPAVITITGKGNFTGSRQLTFQITRIAISKEDGTAADKLVIGKIADVTYSGSPKTPSPSVKYNGKSLKKDVDYRLTYENNVNAGTSQVTITGIGVYEGTLETSFKIKPCGIEKLTVGKLPDLIYMAESHDIDPGEVTLTIGKEKVKLEKGKDYDVRCLDTTDAGTGKVVFAGKGNYTGMCVKTCKIKPRPLSEEEFTAALLFNGEKATAVPYTGKAIKPDAEVKFTGIETVKTLQQGKDYTLSYSKNTGRGEAVVTIKGKGNYSGSIKRTFTIEKASLSGAQITVADTVYTGKALKPSVKVTDAAGNTIKASEYTVAYSNNTDSSIGKSEEDMPAVTVTAKEKGNYTGEAKETFRIGKKLAAASVQGLTAKVYTGEEICPEVTLQISSGSGKNKVTEEVPADAYEVAYASNINKGTAKVIITAKEDSPYVGSITKTFSIKAKPVSELTVEEMEELVYFGKAQKPKPVVKLGEKVLAEKTDYTLSYSKNTNAGEGIVTVTGKGNYTGSRKEKFTIRPLNLADVKVEADNLAYSAKSSGKPKVTVTVNLDDTVVTIPSGVYTVRYDSYKGKTGKQENTITITAKGSNTTGSNSANVFYIGTDLKSAKIGAIPAQVYDTDGVTPPITVTLGKNVVDSDCYTVSYEKNMAAGTGTVIVKGKGEKGYIGQVKKNFTIQAKPLTDGSIRVQYADKMVYTGKALTQEIEVFDGDKKLTPKVDYTVSYSSNTKIGTAKITVTGKKNYKGKWTGTFEIVLNGPDSGT